MEQPQAGRRRMDRVTAEDYLEGLSELSVAEVRGMRDECRDEEARLSYTRRLLQGKLDVIKSERARRQEDRTGSGSLVASLPKILADEPPAQPREARTIGFYRPPEEGAGRRREDASLEEPTLATLPDMDGDALAELVENLRGQEAEVSRARSAVLDHLDRLQAELVRRYRDGSGDLNEAVSSSLQGNGGH